MAVESYLDGESQSGRLDEETTEAFDILLVCASLQSAHLDGLESVGVKSIQGMYGGRDK